MIQNNFRILAYINTLFCVLYFNCNIFSQINLSSTNFSIDYSNPQFYKIGGITVSGIKYLDPTALINLTGISVGDSILIPGEEISNVIKKLWKQGLFSDIKISATNIIQNTIFLDIYLSELPRLSKFTINGVRKGEADDIRERIKLMKGAQVTENTIAYTTYRIKEFFYDKGFLNTKVTINQRDDSSLVNNVILDIIIEKNERVKIKEISFENNTVFSDKKLRSKLKNTKQKSIFHVFKSSKYLEKDYKEDKQKIIAKYNEKGYRDALITKDTIYTINNKLIGLKIYLNEGKQYFFRNISWSGNSKYPTTTLNSYLNIKKGDIYDQELLNNKLFVDQNSVSSLYLDNGYLFFSLTPVEIMVENDSIDIEFRIYEGKQATINNVTITGNTKTNDHVIRREIRTKPGDLFSRADIIRTQRELATLGYFNPEKLTVNPTPDAAKGTVDIEYVVEEKPSDQIELSGGWGANMLVGTLGLMFTNFSARNMFKLDEWRPLPSGDGQRLSVRAQSNGKYYQAYNLSFVEPWLGGKKPNSLSVSIYHTIQSNGYKRSDTTKHAHIYISGFSLGLGQRIKWPDDFFTLYFEASYQIYNLQRWNYFPLFPSGEANNINTTINFGRNSVDQPIYPRKGSSFSLSLQLTPPYSLITNKDYTTMSMNEKYKLIEYHKWSIKYASYTRIYENLVLNIKANFGFLGMYSKEYGPSPFEGFDVGGDGLSGYNLYGTEVVSMRGYENRSLTPYDKTDYSRKVGNIYDKFTLEFRYPVSLNPSATIYALAFLEGGNAWYEFKDFKPFEIKRSAGVGIRVFLSMLGMLGVDFGYGFDKPVGSNQRSGWQPHFVIGQQF